MNYGTSISIGVIDSVLRGICFIFLSISERLNDFDVIIFWTGIIMFTTMAMSTLEPTIPIWIIDTMKAPKWQLGTLNDLQILWNTCSATVFAPVAMRLLKLCRLFWMDGQLTPWKFTWSSYYFAKKRTSLLEGYDQKSIFSSVCQT